MGTAAAASGNRESIKLCLVTKQILIDHLPPTLILHFKRFNIDDYHVTKNNTRVTFPHLLNVTPYCTTTCLKVCKVNISVMAEF